MGYNNTEQREPAWLMYDFLNLTVSHLPKLIVTFNLLSLSWGGRLHQKSSSHFVLK